MQDKKLGLSSILEPFKVKRITLTATPVLFILPSLLSKLSQILPRAFLFPLPLFDRFLGCNSSRPRALSMLNSYNCLIKVLALVDQKPSFFTVFPVFGSVFDASVGFSLPLCIHYKLSIKIWVICLCIFKIALFEDICLSHSCQTTSGWTKKTPKSHTKIDITMEQWKSQSFSLLFQEKYKQCNNGRCILERWNYTLGDWVYPVVIRRVKDNLC